MAKLIDDLTVIKQIAISGLASIFEVVDREERGVVLRELLPKYRFNLKMHSMFMSGAAIRAKLPLHKNIVFSYEHGHKGLTPYEIIEFVNGKNIKHLIIDDSPILKQYPLDILIQAATAINFLHLNNILHLDVKSENFILVLNHDGELNVKLTDFDISCSISNTKQKRISGTLVNMPPEQIEHGEISQATDIFSFGVFAYYLLSRKRPFTGSSTQEVLQSLKHTGNKLSTFVPLEEIFDDDSKYIDIDEDLCDIVNKCLSEKVEDRFITMGYVLKALNELKETLE